MSQTVFFSANNLALTADYTIQAIDARTVYTNRGATGTVTVTLPAAKVGMRYIFKVEAAYAFRIDPYGSEQIALPSTNVMSAAGKYISADAAGEYMILECTYDGEWSCFGYLGTWTAES